MKSGLYNRDALTKASPSGFEMVCEGSTAVLFPPALTKKGKETTIAQEKQRSAVEDPDDQAVFYNPAQVVNRDLSICALEVFSKLRLDEPRRRGGTTAGITILEALSATGLRAIRYYKEISNVRYIIANDLDADAVQCIRRNCAFNDVPTQEPTLTDNFPESNVELYPAPSGENGAATTTERGVKAGGAVIPNLDDAVDLMHRLAMNPSVRQGSRTCVVSGADAAPRPLLQQELMDVVDLDPYGSASPFLDGAFRCIKEGGLMLVTSTDSAILCGNYPDTCHAKYNTVPYKGAHCHEMAVRILLASIERVANKHKKYIVPLISLHIDFYIRCFFRVYTQPAEVKLSPCKLGNLLQCCNCPAFWVRPLAVSRPPRAVSKSKKRQRGQKSKDAEEEEEPVVEESNPVKMEGELPKERFPDTPDRQQSPKVTAPTLSRLPTSLFGSSDIHPCGCPICGSSVSLSGPIYAAPTQNVPFLTLLLKEIEDREATNRVASAPRISGLVRAAMDELPQCPLFYQVPDIASHCSVRCPPIPLFVGALARLGYTSSQVHCAGSGLKTDCPPELLFAVMLQWKHLQDEKDAQAKAETSNENPRPEKAASPRCLRISRLEKADFSYDKAFDFRRQATGVKKFIPNAPGWGPKRRHQGAMEVEEE